jgi:hypothetical protein
MVNHAPDAFESYLDDRLPPPRRTSRARLGARGGLVAAAATAGAVIGFGLRNGDWSGPFSSLGYEVLTSLGLQPAFSLLVTTGLIAHVAWMIAWGVVHAFLSARRTAGTAIVIGVVLSASAAVLAKELIPAAFGAVRFASLPGSQVVLCVALMTLGMLSSRAFLRD